MFHQKTKARKERIVDRHKEKNHDTNRISDAVIRRLSRYHSSLCLLAREDVWMVSSQQLAEI
ncbi:MAG: hypothetical protein JRL30_12240 [Deltaproteobacteria bacterium]|nr:hypothetical protein [Deltaproteobacteria bacterium]